ncbi:MAG: carboxypeptidase-like regulatory domain-containing protein, partial [Gemmatimonas sp.]
MNASIRLFALLLAPLFASLASAHGPNTQPAPDAAIATESAATISGIVFDSIARAPLAGATVQLVAASDDGFGKSATSDAAGAFIFTGVPDGRYTIGFFHPMLDSLGLEPLLRTVAVEGGVRGLRVDLAIPSPARLRATICASASAVTSSSTPPSVVMGFVRNASDLAPVAGASVTGEWSEFSIGRGGIARTNPRRVAKTGDNGWFAICGVPSPG